MAIDSIGGGVWKGDRMTTTSQSEGNHPHLPGSWADLTTRCHWINPEVLGRSGQATSVTTITNYYTPVEVG